MGLNGINSLSHTKWNCKYHIQNQLKEDEMGEQLTMQLKSPFTGSK